MVLFHSIPSGDDPFVHCTSWPCEIAASDILFAADSGFASQCPTAIQQCVDQRGCALLAPNLPPEYCGQVVSPFFPPKVPIYIHILLVGGLEHQLYFPIYGELPP